MIKPYRGPLPSLASSAATQEQFIVWCEDCRHQVDDDPADQVDRYGAETTVQLARSARLQSVRRPQGRHGGDRNRVLCFSADRDPLLLRSSRRSPRRLIGRSQATSPDCGHRKNTGLQPPVRMAQSRRAFSIDGQIDLFWQF
jgi:hypothetical protein